MKESTMFGEVYGFDDELLMMVPQPVYAVIANMERKKSSEDRQRGDSKIEPAFYMK